MGSVRTCDTVVRWGGEEFLVVARHTDRSLGSVLATRIIEAFRDQPFDLGQGVSITKTCSLGFCPFPVLPREPGAITWQQAVEVADRCLYAAKLSGRDGWVGVQGLEGGPAAVAAFLGIHAQGSGTVDCVLDTSFGDPSILRWQ
jgi:diguanylate cyclase (GGDEF)-like protein